MMMTKSGCEYCFRAILTMVVAVLIVKAETGSKKEFLARHGSRNQQLPFVTPQTLGASGIARRTDNSSLVRLQNAKTLQESRGVLNYCVGVPHTSHANNGRTLFLLRRDRGPSGPDQTSQGYAGSSTARRGLPFQNPDPCLRPGMALTCGKHSNFEGVSSEPETNNTLAEGDTGTNNGGGGGVRAGGGGGWGRRAGGVGMGGTRREAGARNAAYSGRGGGGDIGGAREAGRQSLWAMYQRSMSERPLLTKSVTAAIISSCGQLLGSAIRASSPSYPLPPPPITPPSALVAKAGVGVGAGWRAGAGMGVRLAGGSPGLLRRVAAFAIYGLVVTGPVFHWWYKLLERVAARRRQADESPGGARDIAFKLAMDRFVLTPPYLAITLLCLRYLQGFGMERSLTQTKALFLGALITNWKVCTMAKLFNFMVVPLDYRPVFGNMVAFCWYIYLSLLSLTK